MSQYRPPTQAEWRKVCELIDADRAKLTPREQRFVALVTFGQRSPTAAARELGYKSPATMAAKIMRREHVANCLLAFRELCRELMLMIEREEMESK